MDTWTVGVKEAVVRLDLSIESRIFAEQLAREISAGGLTVVDAVERLLGEHLEDSVAKALGSRLVKVPRSVVHSDYYKNRFENLANLCRRGYCTWYPELRFATRRCDTSEIAEITTAGFNHGYVMYGGRVNQEFRYSAKELKTQVNHTVRLNKLSIPAEVFSQAKDSLERNRELEQPYIANLTVGFNNFVDDRLQGFRVVSFDHVVRGSRRFCSCHADAHASMLSDARGRAPSYVPQSWPHRVIDLLEAARYSDGLCHFCIVDRYGEDASFDWYGDQIRTHYEPYVDLLVRTTDMDWRTAEAETRRRLTISRWVREDELYRLIAMLFPTKIVRREASPRWLGRQRLDIYLPEIALAIEHQGGAALSPRGGIRW